MVRHKTLSFAVLIVVVAVGISISVLTSHAQTPASPPTKTSLHLNGVGLNVADLARSEKFYTEVFGLQRVMRYPAEGKLLEVGLKHPDHPDEMLFVLAHFNDDPLPEEKSAFGRIIINTTEAKALADRAEAAGSTLRNLGQPGGPVVIFLDDPDGYQIELYQAASGA